MKAAIAFDASGVFIKSGKAIQRSSETLNLLKQFKIPFVVLTNAGGKKESARAQIFNKILETELMSESNVIQAHTPMKMIYHDLKEQGLLRDQDSITLIGGSEECHEICDEYGFSNFITVQEMCGVFPILVPLVHKYGYPSNVKEIQQRVKERFRVNDLNDLMKRKFKCIMIFSNPYMYEAHIQVMSDALVSKDGIYGTIRQPNEPQYPQLYYAHTDLIIPYQNDELPHLKNRLSLGAFTKSFSAIFSRQFKGYSINYQITGKPSHYAFDYAKHQLSEQGQSGKLCLYMVGDNPKSDIRGGNENGFETILVKTGNYQPGMPTEDAKHIVDDAYEAVNLIVKKHYYC